MSLDRENGRLFLLGEKDWVFNALEVLHDYGFIRPPFFVYPPYPGDAHIKIVTKREAEDHELFGRDLSHLTGKSVEFEVYQFSNSLSEIREELTGLSSGPNNGHFVIVVGLRMDAEEFQQKFSQQTNAEFKIFDEDTSDDEEEIKPSLALLTIIAIVGALSFFGYKSMSK